MCRRLLHTPKISQKFTGEWKFGLYCYGRDEIRAGYHSALVQLFRGISFQGIWQCKCSLFENSQTASRATCGPRVWDPWFRVYMFTSTSRKVSEFSFKGAVQWELIFTLKFCRICAEHGLLEGSKKINKHDKQTIT